MQARLDNMLANRDHLENFVKSLAANPKQFTDYGARLGEVAAPTLIVWGETTGSYHGRRPATAGRLAECAIARVQPLRTLGAVGARGRIQSHGHRLSGALER